MRYRILERTHPQIAGQLMAEAQAQVDRKWALYQVTAEHWAGQNEDGDAPPRT